MRQKVTPETLKKFMEELASSAKSSGNVYLTGGATALLLGFREQTLDIDIKLDPEPAGVFEAIAKLKNELNLNVELASPDDFIPARPDWRQHSKHIASIGEISFFHYDFALQVLAKIERGHAHDLEDAKSFVRDQHVSVAELRGTFRQIEPNLLRYPAIDPGEFRRKLEDFLQSVESK